MEFHAEPQARIFVCINEKVPEKKQCLKGEGEKCLTWLKEEIKKRSLQDKIWVTKTRCQSYCDKEGTSVLFEPVHEQYSALLLEDVQRLFEEFLKKIRVY